MSVRLFFMVTFIYLILINVEKSNGAVKEYRDLCGYSLNRPNSFLYKHVDWVFWRKFFKHWIPFTDSQRVNMQFLLFKREFPECGREIKAYKDDMLEMSGFNAEHPTRIVIHGWLSQSKGSLNRAVKNAYLNLAQMNADKYFANITTLNEEKNTTDEIYDNDDYMLPVSNATDFNVIIVDWSIISSNVNYFGVVELIDVLGFMLAELLRYLNIRVDLNYDDVYLIGHSLGAQIAGSTGRQLNGEINTIFALDPAGPKFRDLPEKERINPTDAKYVESIQTSSTLGFEEPVGHASFYPNFGHDQKNCYVYGCSHKRAHRYFAESIDSRVGFWGVRCKREEDKSFTLLNEEGEFLMGGEPSIPKEGTFYVKTNSRSPYAMGRLIRNE